MRRIKKEDARYNGYTVVDLSTILATHLTEIIKLNLHELFGRQELAHLLDNFKEHNEKIHARILWIGQDACLWEPF